eukprot:2375877-Rhodomonas_salina.1
MPDDRAGKEVEEREKTEDSEERRHWEGSERQGAGSELEGGRCYLMGNSAAIIRELKTDPKWADTKVAATRPRAPPSPPSAIASRAAAS